MKAPRVPESLVQWQIVRLLRSLGAAVYVLGTVRRKGDYQGTNQTPGISDLCVFLRGRQLWIEVKAEGGRLSPAQRAFQAQCHTCGVAHVVGGVSEVLAWLVDAGIVKADGVAHYRQPAPRQSTNAAPGKDAIGLLSPEALAGAGMDELEGE